MDITPDKKCIDKLLKKFKGGYFAQWIKLARENQKSGQLLEATYAYTKARNGFGKKSREWRHLDAWRAYMSAQAIASGPKLALVMMQPEFYQRLELAEVPLPVPVSEVDAVTRHNQWTPNNMLENLRYYLLANEGETDKYRSIIVRLAYEAGLLEGLHGDIERADYYFSIANNYGRGNLNVIVRVAYGYLKVRVYDKALREFEKARKMLIKSNSFEADIWLHVANLNFCQGNKIKGKNVILDYIDKSKLFPGDLPRKAIEYAFKWMDQQKADQALVAILTNQKGS